MGLGTGSAGLAALANLPDKRKVVAVVSPEACGPPVWTDEPC